MSTPKSFHTRPKQLQGDIKVVSEEKDEIKVCVLVWERALQIMFPKETARNNEV